MKRTSRRLLRTVAVLAAVGLAVTGCMTLGDAIQNQLGGDVIGATPTQSFAQDGSVNLSMFGRERNKNDVTVEVQNGDGSWAACELIGGDDVQPSKFNSLALLIDDSGSMERAYPEAQYPGLCPTCPHDPDRRRAAAAKGLIESVLTEGPESRIGLMDFGPAVSEGWTDTQILTDFTNDLQKLSDALQAIDGSQEAGTPLWDSLAEIVTATDEDAVDFEAILQSEGRKDEETGAPAQVKRYIVVLSDGDDRDSDAYNLESLILLAQERDVTIHAIGLGPAAAANKDPRLQLDEQIETVRNLQRLADATGGIYASVDDPASLEALYTIVGKSLVAGYIVETYSCLPDGAAPASGQIVNGRTVIGEETSYWTVIAP